MSKKNEINVTVDMIDAKLEINVGSRMTGRQLFDQIIKTVNIRETWYFGLTYTDTKNFDAWVKMNRKLCDHDFPKKNNVSLRFRARFFPEDASEELILSSSKNMFYLQVKQQLMNNELYCPAETCVLLASYVCLIKYGDYDSGKYPEGEVDVAKLLPTRILDQHNLTSSEWENKILPWYKEHRDMLKDDAMVEYLKIVQDLEMYGITYYEIRNKRGVKLWLGVDALGMNVYEESDKLTPKVGFPWSEISKVRSAKREFRVRSSDKSGTTFAFVTVSQRVCHNILERCLGNYDLYKKRRSEESIEVQQMKALAQDERELKLLQRQKLANERQTREAAEKRLKELEAKFDAQRLENEKNERAINDYKEKIRLLEEKVAQEKRQRQELEEMRKQLQDNNMALKAASSSSEEEYKILMSENERIQREMENKNFHLASTEEELSRYRSEIDNLQRQQDFMIVQQREKEDALSAAEARASALLYSNNHNDVNDEGDVEELLIPMINIEKDRDEEARLTNFEKDKNLQSKLNELAKDLMEQRDESKLQPQDKQHDEIRREGRDKFKTLKQVRQGNTKKRVDAFESISS